MKSKPFSVLLVLLQTAGCIALLWLGWSGIRACPWLWIGVFAGAAIMVSGILAIRISQLRMTPEPGAKAVLCRSGPYRFIRHPMYTGLLLAFGMFALAEGGWAGSLTWLGLFAVLWIKLQIEERHWLARDPEYAAYQRETKRLVPWVF